ncbi:MAG: hypothetical protein ABFS37_06420 [Acidobacteriota bacterium]
MVRTRGTGASVLLAAMWTGALLFGTLERVSAADNPAQSESPEIDNSKPVSAALLEQGYSISWWTVDGGGGTSVGGALSLGATLAQPDAGSLAGSDLTLDGGFWSRAMTPPEPPLFSDGFETGDTSRWSSAVPLKNRKAAK